MASVDDVLPGTSIGLEQLIRVLRAPGAGRIIGKCPRGKCLPDVEDRVNDAPAGLDHVGTLKQRRIADHTVEEQPFVACTDLLAEVVEVVKIHIDGAHVNDGPWDLGTEMKRNAFVRLNMNDDAVCGQLFDRRIAKQYERSLFELNDDRRIASPASACRF